MSTLKQLRLRINGVKSTEKITKAMKMVSASKLSKAQEAKDHLKPYANKMYNVVAHLAGSVSKESDLSPLIIGNGRDNIHLLVVISSDKGLCGNFNSCIVKTVKQHINSLQVEGKECKILCLGKKAYEQLKHHYNKHIIGVSPGFNKAIYDEANKLADKLMDLFKNHEFDTCSFIYTEFKNAMKRNTCIRKIIPLNEELSSYATHMEAHTYEYEPSEDFMLQTILPLNLAVQIYYMILETIASEHGARMTAMDSASKNAKEMIGDLTLLYNRSRQATITRELIEIISSAEIV
jgi:F-type H+-transporting ATPase subunit gamma